MAAMGWERLGPRAFASAVFVTVQVLMTVTSAGMPKRDYLEVVSLEVALNGPGFGVI